MVAFSRRLFRLIRLTIAWASVLVLIERGALGQLEFESPPVNYGTAPACDRIARLQAQLDRGETNLKHDDAHGYLRSVLNRLDVPVSSQMLVFSKTSFQQRRISPSRPRALYFNDDVYVGWVQGGDIVEVSSADPRQGAIFYTLGQKEVATPQFVRDRGQCIVCHASSRTAGVPGHLVRSVYPDRRGQPHFGSGTFTTDHRSPFNQRWGGWYVSGTHGAQRHLGNTTFADSRRPDKTDLTSGANAADLSQLLKVSPYLAPGSDIVALMVLEHQTRMQNLITRAGFETRIALHYDQTMNQALARPADYRSDTTTRRIESVGDKLVEYMLFADEFQLQDAVRGTSGFAEEFAARGPFDSQGRSLRQFDLAHRLMKYRCSYLIYGEPFDALPDPVSQVVYRRLFDILTGADNDGRAAHLAAAERTAILEILRETKTGLPDYWQTVDY
jgi:hypothetical protein